MAKPAKSSSKILRKTIGSDVKTREGSRAQKESDIFVDVAALRERMDHMATEAWVWWRLAGVASAVLILVVAIIGAIGGWVHGLVSLLTGEVTYRNQMK